MQKKAGTHTYCGPTTRFCEPWPVQPVHTIPLFQALNGTVGRSSLYFFSHTMLFGLMSVHVKQIETLKSSPHSLKFQSLFELSTSPSLLTLSITSLISAFSLIAVAAQPRLQLTLSITLCLSHTFITSLPHRRHSHYISTLSPSLLLHRILAQIARYYILFNSSFFYVNLYFLANFSQVFKQYIIC